MTATLYNTATQDDVNDLNNLGVRGQVLFAPSDKLAITTAVDYTRQRPEGYTQVVAGVAPTLRPANRQYPQIAADLGYTPPSFNAFDRVTDIDSPLRSYQDLGGASLNVDWKLGPGRLTSTTAWRYWDWDPSNDRDFIGLPVTTISAGTSTQRQWTQEVRYAGDVSPRMNFVVGAFVFHQAIDSDPVIKQEQGSAAARFLLAPSALAATPGLLDGYGFDQYLKYRNVSAALFGQLEWSVTDRLRLLPGLRFNYDQKDVDFDQQVYGGLQTTNPALIALQLSILAPQAYKADVDDTNLSGQMTAAYKVATSVNTYATYATSFKSVGLNLNGVPTDALGRPVLSAATVRPEDVHHFEVGLKTEPLPGVTANVTVFDTEIKDFQAQVVNASVGVLRGYLANAEKVRVRGARVRRQRQGERQSLALRGRRLHRRQVRLLPGRAAAVRGNRRTAGQGHLGLRPARHLQMGGSPSAASTSHPGSVLGRHGQFFGALDASYRSVVLVERERFEVSDGRRLFSAQRPGRLPLGGWVDDLRLVAQPAEQGLFRLAHGAPGNTGLYVGQPGDPRTVGVTLRMTFASR